MKIATHCKEIEWWGRLDKGYLPCGCVTGGESDVVNDCIFPSPMRSPIGHWCYTPITKYVSWLCLSFCCVEFVMYINNNEVKFHKLRKRMSQPSNQKLLLGFYHLNFKWQFLPFMRNLRSSMKLFWYEKYPCFVKLIYIERLYIIEYFNWNSIGLH